MARNTDIYPDFTSDVPSPFKSTGFRIATVVFVLITVLAAVIMVLAFTGNLPFDYSYSYSVNYGDGGYSEQESYNIK